MGAVRMGTDHNTDRLRWAIARISKKQCHARQGGFPPATSARCNPDYQVSRTLASATSRYRRPTPGGWWNEHASSFRRVRPCEKMIGLVRHGGSS